MQLFDLSFQLKVLRDVVDSTKKKLMNKDRTNGEHATRGLQGSRVRAVAYFGQGRSQEFVLGKIWGYKFLGEV